MFSDVRQFVHYVLEVHGCTFRLVMLSGLLDPLRKLKLQQMREEARTRWVAYWRAAVSLSRLTPVAFTLVCRSTTP